MPKRQKNSKPKVFFNASVILAGLYSPRGGSAKMLDWVKRKKIKGFISEVVLEEAKRHSAKIKLTPKDLEDKIKYLLVTKAPPKLLTKYKKIVEDKNDIHLFTSSEMLNVDYLVSLDKKHVLSLSKRIKKFKIVSPAELIEELS